MDRGTARLVPRQSSCLAATVGSSRRHPGGMAKLAFGQIPTKNLRDAPFAAGTACLHWQHGELMQADKIAQLRHAVIGRLESLQQAGVLQISKECATIRIAGERSLANSDVTAAEATAPSVEVASAQMEAPMKKKPSRGGNPAASLFEAVEASAKRGT